MPSLIDLKDSRAKLLHSAQEILIASPDAEKRASAKKMLADVEEIETTIADLETIEKKQSEIRTRTAPPREKPTGGLIEDTSEELRAINEKKAFEQFIRRGHVDAELRSYMRENRDVLAGSTAASFVPQSFYQDLFQAAKSYGNILNYVKNFETADGSPMKMPISDDTSNGLSLLGEATAASETDPTITGSVVATDTLTTGVVRVSFQMLADSAFDINGFIRDAMGARYYRGLSSMVTNGNGSNIASIIASTTASVTSAAPTSIAWGDIAALYAALDPAYSVNASFVTSPATRGVLLGTVDTLGRPIFLPSTSSSLPDTLMGRTIVIDPFMQNVAASHTTLLYGDLSSYLVRSVQPGLSILRLDERFADTLECGFIGYSRNSGVLLQGSIPTIVKLIQHS